MFSWSIFTFKRKLVRNWLTNVSTAAVTVTDSVPISANEPWIPSDFLSVWHFKVFDMRASSCLYVFCVCSPKRGPARRKAWPGRTTGRGNPTKPLCTPPRLSSGPPAGRTSDRHHDREHHDIQVRRSGSQHDITAKGTCELQTWVCFCFYRII